MRRAIFSCSVGCVAVAACHYTHAQQYSAKPVRLIVPHPPGGRTAVTDASFVRLQRYRSNAQIVELTGAVALNGFLDRWNDTMAPAPHGWRTGRHEG